MANAFSEIAFTPAVKAKQEHAGSRRAYANVAARVAMGNDRLGEDEKAFIAARDSFYMATVSETGWPYIQHRGGPAGFVKAMDDKTLGFADFAGNRQYISVGNLAGNDLVSMFFMDYGTQARLKLLGRARVIGPEDDETLRRLTSPDYGARIERAVLIDIEAFDWNCPQHITQRFTLNDVETATVALRQRIAELEAQLAEARN